MEILLTDDVLGLGDIGEQVRVRPGYARNFLIPRGLAVEVQAKGANVVKHKMSQVLAKKQRMKLEAKKLAEQMQSLNLVFSLKVGSGSKVFGSINAKDISARFAEFGLDVVRRRILLSEPLKNIGISTVKIKLHAEIAASCQVKIEALEASEGEEQEAVQEAKENIEEQAAFNKDKKKKKSKEAAASL